MIPVMSGYQFLHIQSFSRKADAEGRTVDFVLAEAARRGDACQHVDSPSLPGIVFGLSVNDIRTLHDSRLADAHTTNRDGKSRKLRVDHHTLLTAVLSHPATVSEALDDPSIAAEVRRWEEMSVEWLQATWGDELASVIRHTDEEHCHLHAFIVPRGPEMRARMLHPGIAAKDLEKEAAIADGVDAKTANAIGDKAYKSALRGMQDSFWQSVGLPSGLARLGPARRRLTRAEWKAEQAGMAATAVALRVAHDAEERAVSAAKEAEAVTSEIDTRVRDAANLEARAKSAARRATQMVMDAKAAAANAKAASDAAEARRAEAERQARAISTKANRMVGQAKADSAKIVEAARHEAALVVRGAQRLGAWFGSVWFGLIGKAPSAIAREAAALARADERRLAEARLSAVREKSLRTESRLQATEQQLASVAQAVVRASTQRDELAATVASLRPAPTDSDLTLTPKPNFGGTNASE